VVEGAGSALISGNMFDDVAGRRGDRLPLERGGDQGPGKVGAGRFKHLTVERNAVA
jgi:hypothetical protein